MGRNPPDGGVARLGEDHGSNRVFEGALIFRKDVHLHDSGSDKALKSLFFFAFSIDVHSQIYPGDSIYNYVISLNHVRFWCLGSPEVFAPSVLRRHVCLFLG